MVCEMYLSKAVKQTNKNLACERALFLLLNHEALANFSTKKDLEQ